MSTLKTRRCPFAIGRLGVVTATVLLGACGASLNNGDLGGLGAAGGPEATLADSAAPGAPAAAPAGAAPVANPAAEPGKVAAPVTPAATPVAAPGSPAASSGYKIGANDVLEVAVFKVPELSKSVQVTDAGTVNLPLVGEIVAAGRTPRDVERDLAQKLGAKYLQSPQVSVFVKEYNSQRITIDGAVKKPGVMPYRSSITLLQVIAMADGLDADSDSTVVVFRETDGKKSAARFDVDEIRSGAAQDPQIKPGDTIVVGSSMLKSAFNQVLKVLPLAGLFVGL
jgi:polysaccharide export outer membrane protein